MTSCETSSEIQEYIGGASSTNTEDTFSSSAMSATDTSTSAEPKAQETTPVATEATAEKSKTVAPETTTKDADGDFKMEMSSTWFFSRRPSWTNSASSLRR